MSFFEYKKEDRVYLKSTILEKAACHCFTTKLGGVSKGKIEGLNLGFRVNDDESSVRENYRLIAKDLGINLEKTVLSRQTHTDNIRIVTEADCGKGITRKSDIEDTDGLITNLSGVALVVFSADCTPVLMCDKEAGVVAAVHAGWRGSVKGIVPKCVQIMKESFKSRAENIKVAIGASIGPCCFEFGQEAEEYFAEEYLKKTDEGKYKVDLWKYNTDLLVKEGVNPENIDLSGICTVCHNDRFYSYRAHKEKTGRLGAVIMR